MVRLPVLVGSEPPSPPSSPLKSFPWMRFVEDIARGWRGVKEDRKRVGRKVEV